jgi:hypothetical protein
MTIAKSLVKRMGKKLIGRTVITPAMGSYPGGPAKVVKIRPDLAAPDIAFNVENPAWTGHGGGHIIGIFFYEDVELQKMLPGEGRGGQKRKGWPGVPLDPVLACICRWCDPPKDEGGKPPCDSYKRPHSKYLDLELYCVNCDHPRKCHSPYREQYTRMRADLEAK